MASLNKVILIGNIANDLELKQTPAGVSVVSFRLAVNRQRTKEKVCDFIDIVAWRQTAEFITRYFKKGKPISIVGALQTRSYTDKNGNKRNVTEVVADEAGFVESKSADASTTDAAPSYADTDTAPKFEAVSEEDDLPF